MFGQNDINFGGQPGKTSACIKVIGVGGGGCNAVNRMILENIQGVEFWVVNTDAQVLASSKATNRIVLGEELTKGLGAGADPVKGREASIESEEKIKEALRGADLVFVAAGMGGGTGTGAAPIVAKIAKDMGALTIAIVTRPFSFEGSSRMENAQNGIQELRENVDSLIIVSNDKLLEEIGNIPLRDAFQEADKVLRQGVQTITDLIAVPSLINLDFADVRTTMEDKGYALIGIGISKGENKAEEAAHKAISSPLLEASISGAQNAIINVTGGANMTLFEANTAVDIIRQQAGTDINIIFGVAINEQLQDEMIVTVIATGFDEGSIIYADPEIIHQKRQEWKSGISQSLKSTIRSTKEFPSYTSKRSSASHTSQHKAHNHTQQHSAVQKNEIDLDDDIPSFLKRG